jgi:hypothetical protein
MNKYMTGNVNLFNLFCKFYKDRQVNYSLALHMMTASVSFLENSKAVS